MSFLENLQTEFNGHVAFRQRRPGLYQLHAPLFHEDGDMVDIFLSEFQNGQPQVRVSDEGMTLMRLSYSYDVDTESRQRVLRSILAENQVLQENGCLYLNTEMSGLYPAVLQFAQTAAKVSSMQYFRREATKSMFYEMLEEFILDNFARFNPKKAGLPIPDQDAYEVDWQFDLGTRPIYLFGVKDRTKALLTTIACQAFAQRELPHRSVAVHQDFNALSNKDRSRITNACDKQFATLDDFQAQGLAFFEREAA